MKLKIIFLISISGFVIASDFNDNNWAVLLRGRLPGGRNQARLRPISPSKPHGRYELAREQRYIRNLEEHSMEQLLFLAEKLKAIIAVHHAGIGMSRNDLKLNIQAKVRQGDMKEKDGVMLLRLLSQLARTAYEGLELRLSPEPRSEPPSFDFSFQDDVD